MKKSIDNVGADALGGPSGTALNQNRKPSAKTYRVMNSPGVNARIRTLCRAAGGVDPYGIDTAVFLMRGTFFTVSFPSFLFHCQNADLLHAGDLRKLCDKVLHAAVHLADIEGDGDAGPVADRKALRDGEDIRPRLADLLQ